jgi:hypothetical protein
LLEPGSAISKKRAQKSPPAEADGLFIQINPNLPVTAAAATMASAGESATCVASTAEATANVTTRVAAAYMASGISAARVSTGRTAIGANAATVNSTSAESAAITVAAAISVATVAPAAVIPRAGANKEAADEPARTVIAVGSAAIRCVRIVAPITDRGTIGIGCVDNRRTDANSNPNLSVCRGRESKRQNQEHCHQNQPKTFH